jgi:outer membrane receptor protein involved in Fe transport
MQKINSRFTFLIRPINRQVSKTLIVLNLLFYCLVLSEVKAAEADQVNAEYDFNIPQQPLSVSLNKLSDIGKISFLFPYDLVVNKTGRSVRGRFTVQQALDVLLAQSNLKGELSDKQAFIIKPMSATDNKNNLGNTNMTTKKTLLASMMGLMFASSANAQAPESAKTTEQEPERIIVTGVFKSSSEDGSAVAVSSIGEETLRRTIAVSTADVLKDIPGVFVNTALGEVRNIVYSRGISANSLDGNNGYFYVSMQEDGLPVQNAIMTNFGPDLFFRVDLMTKRVEAVRGGASAITGANAPGGIFNYLTKTGASDPGTIISARLGSEGGEFGNPYYRTDFYHGRQINDNLSFAVGGFYRDGTGPRDPGYSTNRGGQIRANVLYEYDNGSIQFNYKNLNDHNIWDEFLPVEGLRNPRPLGQFDFNSSVNPSRVPHTFRALDSRQYLPGTLTDTDHWDPKNLIHNTSQTYSVSIQHDLNDSWSIENKFKRSENNSDWNTGAAIFAMGIDVAGIYGPAPFGNGILAVGVTGENGFEPYDGTLSFSDNAGNQLAQVSALNGEYTVLSSSLPDDPALPNAILVQTAFAPETGADEFINQFTLSKELDDMAFYFGNFYSESKLYWRSGEGGTGLSQFTPEREMLNITIERPDGTVQQVTSPDGFAGEGRIGAFQNFASLAEQEQISFFFGHTWDISQQWNLNWGLRSERITVEGSNQVASQFTDETGGIDGDPNTLYDNTIQSLGFPVRYKRTFNSVGFSGALTYRWNDNQSTYFRYSDSEKAPSVAAFVDPGAGVNDGLFVPQSVLQIEVGHTISAKDYRLVLTPFYTELTDIGGFGSPVQFTDTDGTTYLPPSLLSAIETFGIEIEGHYNLTDKFKLNLSTTLQDSTSTDNAAWRSTEPGRADDFIEFFEDGDAANTAKFQGALTGTYTEQQWSAFATIRHLGDRPANANNTFDLQGFTTIDIGATYFVNDNVRLNLNVNNLTNEHGVMSWQGAGDFSGLDRSISPRNELWSVVQQQPRSIFVTATYSFE